MTDVKKGSLKVVGTGIYAVNQTTISARNHIENADLVFSAVPEATGAHWIQSLNENVISLISMYEEGKSRVETYTQMIDAMAGAVRDGKRVVAVYYGHPGVFVTPTHKVIALLREEGFEASMDPGISAEDCLFADLGIDPGMTGCQAMESTQFLFYKHHINPHNLLILWQVNLCGEHTLKFMPEGECPQGIKVLTESLLAYYPQDHEVIIYEAATMPLMAPRIERMPLAQLPQCKLSMISTLVIPSIGLPQFDTDTLSKLGIDVDMVLSAVKAPQ